MNLVPWRKPTAADAWDRLMAASRAAGDPIPQMTVNGFAELVTYLNHSYALGAYSQPVKGNVEIPDITSDFAGLSRRAFKDNAVVFACMRARAALFCEARFKYRQLRAGRPGDLFGDPSLAILERPWPNGTTGDLLARMEQDASLSGNFYGRVNRVAGEIQRMRPDWVNILLGSNMDAEDAAAQLDATILGYAYFPGGPNAPNAAENMVVMGVDEVIHYAPTPDPEARFRGMSWLTPVVREIQGDSGYTDHKIKFLENGAVTNLFMVIDKDVTAQNAKVFQEQFTDKYEGLKNRFKTMFVGGGATPTPVGSNFVDMDFKSVQGAGETRIAAAAGTPPAVVGLSEGLQGSTLNTGNFDAAMRLFTDITIRELWRKTAAALSIAVPVPNGAELWYDDRDIPALKEDIKKAGERLQADSASISTLYMAGFDPDACVDAITSGDLARLKGKHAGLPSVQVQPGTPDPAATNGNSGAKALTP